MTVTVSKLTERDRVAIADQQGRACACDQHGGCCLAHYGVADNPTRARIRRKLGIYDFEGRKY